MIIKSEFMANENIKILYLKNSSLKFSNLEFIQSNKHKTTDF